MSVISVDLAKVQRLKKMALNNRVFSGEAREKGF